MQEASATMEVRLFHFFVALLAVPLASESLFRAALLAGFQVEGVTLDLFDNVFLLHLTLEAPQSALQSFAVLHMYFSQLRFTSSRPRCASPIA